MKRARRWPLARLAADLTTLAAVERAERQEHQPPPNDDGVYRRQVAKHLGAEWNPGTTRRLLEQLESLESDGFVALGKTPADRSKVKLTPQGQNRLQRARREKVADALPEMLLPESPQHRTWREAREAAETGFDEFLTRTTAAVQDAETVLMSPAGGGSEELLGIGDRLLREFWRLASATYCLREWPEPDERRPDFDDPTGRALTCLPPRREVSAWADTKLFPGDES